MKPIYKIISIFLCVFTLQSCVEEITLPSNFESAIFIFGNLSNEEEYVKITVMEATPVTDSSKKNIIDAEISLFTESNDVKSLVTKDFKITSDKLYKSIEKIKPIIGNYYWIEVKLQDGTTFKSSKEKLLKPVEILKITYEDDGSLKIYFEDTKDTANYYSLELSSTRNSDFYIDISKTESDILYDGNKNAYIETYLFFIGGSPAESDIIIKLSNINFKTYQFFLNLLDKKEENTHSEEEVDPSELFASPPVNLIGNIINTTTNKKVLGNFGVLSKSQIPIREVSLSVK